MNFSGGAEREVAVVERLKDLLKLRSTLRARRRDLLNDL